MIDYEDDSLESVSVGYQNVYRAMQAGEVCPLDDLHDIEATLALIRKADDRIAFFKDLKKRRAEQIDQEVAKLSDRVEFLKQVVLATMTASKEKSVKFPGVGTASRRKGSDKWEVLDEGKVIEALKDHGEADRLITMVPKIDKKGLNKLLGEWQAIDKLPGGVQLIKGEEGLTLRFDDDIDTSDAPQPDAMSPVPVKPKPEPQLAKASNGEFEEYDKLDFT